MAATDLIEEIHSDSRHRSGQQPPNVTLSFKGVLCGPGTLGTHAARAMASQCPDIQRGIS